MAKNQYAKVLQAKKRAEHRAVRDEVLTRFNKFLVVGANRKPIRFGQKRVGYLIRNMLQVMDEWEKLAEDDVEHADATLDRAYLQVIADKKKKSK
jgi:hypothetical protein